jgi:hypothetical protein
MLLLVRRAMQIFRSLLQEQLQDRKEPLVPKVQQVFKET